MKKKITVILAALSLFVAALPVSAKSDFVYGTTGYGVDMGDAGTNPHDGYCGWSCLRYGVGETLFRFSDEMQPEPWIAESYEFLDENTVRISIREGVCFSNGKEVDGEAVKDCLTDLIEVHDRAPFDTRIDAISAEGMEVVIHTSEPTPALINFLCDPYGCIIDMEAGEQDRIVVGTGPYRAVSVTDTRIDLEKNENYWNGEPKLEKITVLGINDGQTLTAALQNGELDATYGLPYASYALFEGNDAFEISSCPTSRQFFGKMNFASPFLSDVRVRQAICMGIDKEGFVKVLLGGHGAVSKGPFPDNFPFGDGNLSAPDYDPEGAKALLAEAGWTDSDGDGYADKDGEKLSLTWLTYPGRQELPLLAEAAQATLKEIGIEIIVNSTDNHAELWKNGDYDIYVSAMVTAPTGDPEYFFASHMLRDSVKNYEGYDNEELNALAEKLHGSFEESERADLAVKMSQILLDDSAAFFASHLVMGIVKRAGVSGLEPHPCDYYEITADLSV